MVHRPLGVFKTLSGSPKGQNYSNNNAKKLFFFFAVVTFASMVQKQQQGGGGRLAGVRTISGHSTLCCDHCHYHSLVAKGNAVFT